MPIFYFEQDNGHGTMLYGKRKSTTLWDIYYWWDVCGEPPWVQTIYEWDKDFPLTLGLDKEGLVVDFAAWKRSREGTTRQ